MWKNYDLSISTKRELFMCVCVWVVGVKGDRLITTHRT